MKPRTHARASRAYVYLQCVCVRAYERVCVCVWCIYSRHRSSETNENINRVVDECDVATATATVAVVAAAVAAASAAAATAVNVQRE